MRMVNIPCSRVVSILALCWLVGDLRLIPRSLEILALSLNPLARCVVDRYIVTDDWRDPSICLTIERDYEPDR